MDNLGPSFTLESFIVNTSAIYFKTFDLLTTVCGCSGSSAGDICCSVILVLSSEQLVFICIWTKRADKPILYEIP